MRAEYEPIIRRMQNTIEDTVEIAPDSDCEEDTNVQPIDSEEDDDGM